MGHRLFGVDVLARAEGVGDHVVVPMLGGGDEDVVDVLGGQQFAVVLKDLAPGELGGLLSALAEDVADAADFDVVGFAHPDQGAHVVIRLDTTADDADADAVIGRGDLVVTDRGRGSEAAGPG